MRTPTTVPTSARGTDKTQPEAPALSEAEKSQPEVTAAAGDEKEKPAPGGEAEISQSEARATGGGEKKIPAPSEAEKSKPDVSAAAGDEQTPAGEAEISKPEALATIASFISGSSDAAAREYTRAMVSALQPKNIFQSIVAAQLTTANTLALQQAAAATRAEYLPELEHRTRAFGEISRLTLDLTNVYIQMQTNTQINHINIENVSVEKGAQAIVGCVTNGPTAQARLREADNENQEVLRRRVRMKRKRRES